MPEIAEWESFLVAMVGAAAALAGLLVVAISINLREILRYPWLPGRAAETVAMLAGVLVANGVALVPDQSVRALGVELVVVGLVTWSIPTSIQLRLRALQRGPGGADARPPSSQVGRAVAAQLATVPIAAAGVVLVAGSTGGMYVLAAATLVTFVLALLNAWILLVEVLR